MTWIQTPLLLVSCTTHGWQRPRSRYALTSSSGSSARLTSFTTFSPASSTCSSQLHTCLCNHSQREACPYKAWFRLHAAGPLACCIFFTTFSPASSTCRTSPRLVTSFFCGTRTGQSHVHLCSPTAASKPLVRSHKHQQRGGFQSGPSSGPLKSPRWANFALNSRHKTGRGAGCTALTGVRISSARMRPRNVSLARNSRRTTSMPPRCAHIKLSVCVLRHFDSS